MKFAIRRRIAQEYRQVFTISAGTVLLTSLVVALNHKFVAQNTSDFFCGGGGGGEDSGVCYIGVHCIVVFSSSI